MYFPTALFLLAYYTHIASTTSSTRSSPDSTRFEWTALGDSYAVGAGSGVDLGWGRCLRFSESYPEQMLHQLNVSILGSQNQRVLNFPACSGATSSDILAHQFDQNSSFDLEYGERPGFGDPTFATLTAGGDDIDFVNLVRNCIYDILPWRSCQEQRDASWKLLQSQDLVNKVDSVIQKTLSAGRNGSAGDNFRLYVTSYAKFFNDETEQCNNITWSVLPWPFGNRQQLTREIRRDLNDMCDALNGAVKQAVDRNAAKNVQYIDWDVTMEGHRYCESNVVEPCDDCSNTWFWQYPQADDFGDPNGRGISHEDEQTFQNTIAHIWDNSVHTLEELLAKGPDVDKLPEVPEPLREAHAWIRALQQVTASNATGSDDEKGLKFPLWLIDRVRVFHPRPAAHRLIQDAILKELSS